MTFELIQKLITYKSFIEKELLSLQHLLTSNKGLVDAFIKLDYNNPKHLSQMQIQAAEETKIREEIAKLKEEFLKNKHLNF